MGQMKALGLFFFLPIEYAEHGTNTTGSNLPICKTDVS